jgi:hypothetical protein
MQTLNCGKLNFSVHFIVSDHTYICISYRYLSLCFSVFSSKRKYPFSETAFDCQPLIGWLHWHQHFLVPIFYVRMHSDGMIFCLFSVLQKIVPSTYLGWSCMSIAATPQPPQPLCSQIQMLNCVMLFYKFYIQNCQGEVPCLIPTLYFTLQVHS